MRYFHLFPRATSHLNQSQSSILAINAIDDSLFKWLHFRQTFSLHARKNKPMYLVHTSLIYGI